MCYSHYQFFGASGSGSGRYATCGLLCGSNSGTTSYSRSSDALGYGDKVLSISLLLIDHVTSEFIPSCFETCDIPKPSHLRIEFLVGTRMLLLELTRLVMVRVIQSCAQQRRLHTLSQSIRIIMLRLSFQSRTHCAPS